VLLLTESSGTRPTLANMKRALGQWLVNKAGKDDLVLVYYAGHGAPEVDATGRDRTGLSKPSSREIPTRRPST
jgi:16S rRNA G966 N2-methylase RsmD